VRSREVLSGCGLVVAEALLDFSGLGAEPELSIGVPGRAGLVVTPDEVIPAGRVEDGICGSGLTDTLPLRSTLMGFTASAVFS
jgi:hypothetical protein